MRCLVLAACLLAVVPPAGAQTVVLNPQTVEFDPSADHNAFVLGTTTPMVTKYEMRIFLGAATQPVTTQDLGKPAPVNGKISITNRTWFLGLANNAAYTAKVAAVGPSGEGVSAASDPFGNLGPPGAPGKPVTKQ